MRAFIKRTKQCKEFLFAIEANMIRKSSKYDQEFWLNLSDESFHGNITKDKRFFKFMDVRLPSFKIPLKYVRIE